MMSPSEYGQVTLYNSWLSLITIFATLSLYAGVFNSALLKFEDRQRQLTSSMLILTGASWLTAWLTIAVSIYFFGNYTGLAVGLLPFMAFSILANSAYMFWRAQERFYYRYQAVTWVSIVTSICGLGAAVFFIYWDLIPGHKAEIRVVAAATPMTLVGLFLFYRELRLGGFNVTPEHFRYGLAMGLPLIPHYIAQGFVQNFDRFALKSFAGSADVGIYGLAVAMASSLTLFWTAINTTWVPWLLRKYRDRMIPAIRERADQLITAVALLAIAAIFVSPELIRALAPESYSYASFLMPLLFSASLLQFIQSIYLTIQFQEKRVWAITCTSLTSALTGIVLNITLIPTIGAVAVSISLLLSQALQVALQYAFCPAAGRGVVTERRALILSCLVAVLGVLQMSLGPRYALWRYLASASAIAYLLAIAIPVLQGRTK